MQQATAVGERDGGPALVWTRAQFRAPVTPVRRRSSSSGLSMRRHPVGGGHLTADSPFGSRRGKARAGSGTRRGTLSGHRGARRDAWNGSVGDGRGSWDRRCGRTWRRRRNCTATLGCGSTSSSTRRGSMRGRRRGAQGELLRFRNPATGLHIGPRAASGISACSSRSSQSRSALILHTASKSVLGARAARSTKRTRTCLAQGFGLRQRCGSRRRAGLPLGAVVPFSCGPLGSPCLPDRSVRPNDTSCVLGKERRTFYGPPPFPS